MSTPQYTPAAAAEDRTAAILAHASGLIGMVISAGWLSFVGPLIIWALYKDSRPYVRSAAAGAFNFNLGMWVLNIVGWVLIITIIGIPVGIVLLAVSYLGQIICHTLGIVRTTQDRPYRYPMQLPVLR